MRMELLEVDIFAHKDYFKKNTLEKCRLFAKKEEV